MFQHGRDPFLGERPLGVVQVLREDSHGLYYEVDLVPTAGNRELLPLLEAGLLGASFRFTVLAELYDPKPQASSYNPSRLPTRTVTHVRLLEAGPVVFGQYEGASSGIKPALSSIDLAGNSTGSVAASKEPRRSTRRPSWYLGTDAPRRKSSYLSKESPYL
jgi:phage head maturation protease